MLKENFTTDYWKNEMRKIDDCTDCGHCKANCPYEIDVTKMLKEQRKVYFEG
jgi:predicted aldo/keto reductase-like oxidoreductase